MEIAFVVHDAEAVKLVAKGILVETENEPTRVIGIGHAVRLLAEDELARPGEIALFMAPEAARFNGKNKGYAAMATHTFARRDILVPAWAEPTPFQVAFRTGADYSRTKNLTDSLEYIARIYERWNPWVAPPEAPWNPVWAHGAPPEGFVSWRKLAQDIVPEPSLAGWVAQKLPPVFTPEAFAEGSRLLVIGCAAFNRPHTDVVDRLLPRKMSGVVEFLAGLVDTGKFGQVDVVSIGGDILEHPTFRRHLHPFIFMAVEEAEDRLGKPFQEATRLWDRKHARSDTEVAEAFDASARSMDTQLVQPLRELVPVSVELVSWRSILAPYLEEASARVEEHGELLEGIYLERVKTRPSYALLHDIDPVAGMERTFGNAALYVAEALYLRDHPECVVANFEAHDTYWRGLEPVLLPIWEDRVPYIGMSDVQHRQPWGY